MRETNYILPDTKSELEQRFLGSPIDAFAIYQLKGSEDLRDYRFRGLEHLQGAGLLVEHDNYELVYFAPLADFNSTQNYILNKLYEQFNIDHPADFRGHSMSVSDVVALKVGGNISFHYVDSFGFTEQPHFLSQAEHKEESLSYYVAECMEFTSLGEYHENLTLSEAVQYYKEIPTERMNGIKGIGFTLKDGSIYDGDFGILCGNCIDADTINDIEYFKNSHLVQQAIRSVIQAFPQAELIDKQKNYLETAEKGIEQNYNQIDGIINNASVIVNEQRYAMPGYAIIDSLIVGHTEIVIAENLSEEYPYVTSERDMDTGMNFCENHYFKIDFDAHDDFSERVAKAHEDFLEECPSVMNQLAVLMKQSRNTSTETHKKDILER